MHMKPLFDEQRVEEAARFLAAELIKAGGFDDRLAKCPAYRRGLTASEARLALLRALSLVQIELTIELAAQNYTPDDDGDYRPVTVLSEQDVVRDLGG